VADNAPVLIWMSGSDKKCDFFYEGWLKYTCRPVDSELGDGWTEGVHPENWQRSLATFTQAFDLHESSGWSIGFDGTTGNIDGFWT
jgi:PAS domain-containing protein